MPGIACRMMSSRLGLVADVIATESPSQERPVVIQRTWAVTPSVFLCSAKTVLAMTSPLNDSTDTRERIAHQLIHHPPATEARLHEHHPGRFRPHLSDLARLLAALDRPQGRERGVRGAGRDERDKRALVRDVHR